MKAKKIISLIPIIGILFFVGLYIYASTLYPGGSQANLNSKGFDWIHNYWCNLLDNKGMNGQPNPAKMYAIVAMMTLCFSLMIFYILFAQNYSTTKTWKFIITTAGTISMILATLIFTKYHNLIIILSSIFGLFTIIGIVKEIYISDLKTYKITGAFCMLLLISNNYIYYTKQGIEILPLLQKITFLIVFIWIIGLNLKIYTLNKS